jgi:hypothetical protein
LKKLRRYGNTWLPAGAEVLKALYFIYFSFGARDGTQGFAHTRQALPMSQYLYRLAVIPKSCDIFHMVLGPASYTLLAPVSTAAQREKGR